VSRGLLAAFALAILLGRGLIAQDIALPSPAPSPGARESLGGEDLIREAEDFKLQLLLGKATPRPSPSPSPMPAPSASPAQEGPSASPETDALTPSPVATPPPGADEGPDYKLRRDALALDIATAGYYGLLSMIRELKLDERGDIETLRARLRSYYGIAITPSRSQDQAARRSVIIESADSTDYFEIEGRRYARLSGNVSLRFAEEGGAATHRIKAQGVAYEVEGNILDAWGDVVYTAERKGSVEVYYAESMSFDLSAQEGILLSVESVRKLKEGLSLEFSFDARAVERLPGGATRFEDAVITSSEDDPPAWRIEARRLIILGGGEWALEDASLKVGEIPTLWLPWFYYPNEEAVFHPVFGTRDREGYLVQTTTYFLGEKPPKKDSGSILKFDDSGDTQAKRVKGFFLRSVPGEQKAAASKDSLKLMVDAYSNLGFLVAIEGHYSWQAFLRSLDFYAGFALSRNVYSVGGVYTPYVVARGYDSQWNGGRFFGIELPFRFSLEPKLAFQDTDLGLGMSLDLPIVSDPFFDQDFKNRKEDMDWLSFINDPKVEGSGAERSSLNYLASLTYRPQIKDASPWLSSLDSSLKASMSFVAKSATRENGQAYDLVDPLRKLFAPSRALPFEASINARGSLIPPKADAGKRGPQAEQGEDSLVAPWAEASQAAPIAEAATLPRGVGSTPRDESFSFISPPEAISLSPPPPSLSYSLGWLVSGTGKLDASYDSAAYSKASDLLAIGPKSTVANGSVSIGLDGSASLASAFNASLKIEAALKGQNLAYFDPIRIISPSAALDSLLFAAAQQTSARFSQTLALSFTPLSAFKEWSGSSVGYDLAWAFAEAKLADGIASAAAYSAALAAGSEIYAWKLFEDAGISNHGVRASLAYGKGDATASLGLSASLPPKPERYGLSSSVSLPCSTTSFSTALALSGNGYKLEPLTLSETWTPLKGMSLSASAAYAIEETQHYLKTLTASYTWEGLSARFAGGYGPLYQLVIDKSAPKRGWVEQAEKAFQASSATISYSYKGDTAYEWKNRVAWSLSASAALTVDFARWTQSAITVNGAASIKISRFLDLDLSFSSANSSVHRYFPTMLNDYTPKVGFFEDLFKSFNFFNDADRYASAWKLKTLTLKAVHYLDDWRLSLDLSAYPLLVTRESVKQYELVTKVSILLSWIPIPEIDAKLSKTPSATGQNSWVFP
jgi:hypothetical protein